MATLSTLCADYCREQRFHLAHSTRTTARRACELFDRWAKSPAVDTLSPRVGDGKPPLRRWAGVKGGLRGSHPLKSGSRGGRAGRDNQGSQESFARRGLIGARLGRLA